MTPLPSPPWFKRRTFAVSAVAATFALAGMGSVMLQASAQPVDSKIAAKCALGTGTIDVTVPLTVDDKVDPVKAGGSEVLVTKTGLPTLPVEATINKLVVTMPVPTQIGSVDSVSFSGGNMKSSYTVSGSNIIVTFTGPVSSKNIEVPIVTAGLTVRTDAAGPIDWKTFSEVDADTNYGMATCKPNDPNQTVNTTAVTSGTTSTTTGAPTTTAPSNAPSTTAPSKSGGNQVSASAKVGVTASGPSGGTSGSAPGMPSLPTVPSRARSADPADPANSRAADPADSRAANPGSADPRTFAAERLLPVSARPAHRASGAPGSGVALPRPASCPDHPFSPVARRERRRDRLRQRDVVVGCRDGTFTPPEVPSRLNRRRCR